MPVKPRKKFREDEDGSNPMLGDPRIVRGNTHAMARNYVTMKNETMQQSQNQTLKLTKKTKPREIKANPLYSYEVPEFVSSEVDLSLYLIDHESTRREVKDEQTQVDDFKERPITPEYVPRKTGIDQSTQVDDVTDLFDFNSEVAPMLEVIIKKTLEQALFEIQEEEELIALEQEVVRYNEEKEKELQWQIEKETEYTAEILVKQNHLHALKAKSRHQKEVKRRVAGSRCIREIFPSVLEEATTELFAERVWSVTETEEMSRHMMAIITNQAKERLEEYNMCAKMVEELLLAADERFLSTSAYVPPPPPRPLVIRLVLLAESTGSDEDIVLGPFHVTERESVGEVERKIEVELKRKKLDLSPPPSGFLGSVLGLSKPVPPSTPLSTFAFPRDTVELKM